MNIIKNYLSLITILIFFIFQIVVLKIASFEWFLTNTLPDDAFYYFKIAKNIGDGFDSTFDGVNLTNGYHPLWMFIIVPVFQFFKNSIAIKVVLFISVILNLFFALNIRKILTKYTLDERIISTALFLLLFNPSFIYNSFNGLETSLLLFLISLLILKLHQRLKSTGDFIVLGLISGLVILARLDSIIIISILFIGLFLKYYKNLKPISAYIISVLIVYLPWQIYNYLKFKMLLTSASVTSTFVNHELTYSDNGGYTHFLFVKTIIYNLERALQQILEDSGASLLFIGAITLLIFFKFKVYKNKNDLKNVSPIIYILMGILVVVFISAGFRWTYRLWYFMPLISLTPFLYTYVLINLKENFKLNYLFFVTILLCSSFFFYVNYEKKLKDREGLQVFLYKATIWENDNLPEGSKIGVFNSGIHGYFSNHHVVNLDGLVNENASKAMLNRDLYKYIKSEHLDYISDIDSYMSYRYAKFMGEKNILEDLKIIKTFGEKRPLNVYKVNN